jgi:hypothetical protein
MDWAKTPRVLLVWPRKGRVGVRPLDLALLRRHAATLGAELGLVTRDGGMRAAARELGISVFRTTAEAQKKDWVEAGPPGPVRRFPRVDLRALRDRLHPSDPLDVKDDPASRVGIFAIGVLALLAIMLVFIPSAEIRISPPEQPQSVVISVSADPQAETVQLSGIIPARPLTLELSIDGSALSTGITKMPGSTAVGIGLFTNLTRTPVVIPAGTVLLTQTDPPVAFVTVQEAEVPAGKGKTVEISIRAAEPGSSGNVPAGTITAFEEPLGLSVGVTNPLGTSGGTDTDVPLPTDADRQALRSRLLGDLERQARERFAGQVSGGDVLLPSTFALSQVLQETYSPSAGQPATKISLSLKAEYTIFYVSSADLEQLSAMVMDASLVAGSVPVPGTLDYAMASELVESQDIVHWQVRAEQMVRPRIDAGQVIPLVLGKTARRAGSLLTETFGLAESPQISIRPVWWPWLPFLPLQITVES